LPILWTAAFALALGAMHPLGAGSQAQGQDTRGFGQTASSTGTVHNGDYYALVIGIDDYPAPMHPLKTAVNDAKAVGELLTDRYDFKVEYLLNGDATRYKILSALGRYRASLHADDNLLIYYGGHGYFDHDTDKAYWLPVDADSGTSPNTIMADDLTSLLRALPSRHVLVVSDSCYSGGLSRDADAPTRTGGNAALLERELGSRSRTLMASGGLEPVTDAGGSGHSVFASAFLRGLQQDEEPEFTAIDIFYTSIRRQVAGRSSQLPEYSTLRNSSDDGGDFVFVRVRASASPTEPWMPASPRALTEQQVDEMFRLRKYSEALPLLTQACEQGNGVGCNRLGGMYADGLDVKKDSAKAAELYQRSCDDGHPQGCFNLGNSYEGGIGVTRDLVRAIKLFQHSCDEGIPVGCYFATQLAIPTAQEAFARGSDLYEAGKFAEALPFLRSACERRNATGCSNLGFMYGSGKGVAEDDAQAVNFYRMGCDGGDPQGCSLLGGMYATGTGVEPDFVQAVSFLRKGCEGGDMVGCKNLGVMYKAGSGVGKDVVEAARLFRKACDGGEQSGCASLKDLQP
jgi:TPR repeat protein